MIPKGMKFIKGKDGVERCTIRSEVKFTKDELETLMGFLELNQRPVNLDGLRDLFAEITKAGIENLELQR